MPNFVNGLNIFDTYRRFLFILLNAFILAPNGHAQSRQSLEEQRRQTLLQIEETTRILEETQKNRTVSVDKLNLLIAQEKQFNRLISGINAEIAFADRQINETSVTISRMNNEIEKMKSEYARLVFQAYKSRGQYNKLVYVLSAKDFNEAYRRMKYFQQYSEFRKKQVADIKAKQEELQLVIAKLALQKTEKEKLLAEQIRENRRLGANKAEQNKEVNSLRAQERNLRTQLTAQQQKEKRLQAEIEKIITAELKRRNITPANLYDRLTPEERLISNNFKENKGRLPWPTEKGTITGFFGLNPSPLFKNVQVPNNGIDITTVGGATVRSVFDGEILEVGGHLGNNSFVLVQHGSYTTVYSNLVEVTKKKGDKVKSKEVIGKVYTEKGATSAVLHFEIWEGYKDKQNPELWISKN